MSDYNPQIGDLVRAHGKWTGTVIRRFIRGNHLWITMQNRGEERTFIAHVCERIQEAPK